MAMVECPECGKSVSNSAIACPNCGYGVAAEFGRKNYKANNVSSLKVEKHTFTQKIMIGVMVFLILNGVVFSLMGIFGVFSSPDPLPGCESAIVAERLNKVFDEKINVFNLDTYIYTLSSVETTKEETSGRYCKAILLSKMFAFGDPDPPIAITYKIERGESSFVILLTSKI